MVGLMRRRNLAFRRTADKESVVDETYQAKSEGLSGSDLNLEILGPNVLHSTLEKKTEDALEFKAIAYEEVKSHEDDMNVQMKNNEDFVLRSSFENKTKSVAPDEPVASVELQTHLEGTRIEKKVKENLINLDDPEQFEHPEDLDGFDGSMSMQNKSAYDIQASLAACPGRSLERPNLMDYEPASTASSTISVHEQNNSPTKSRSLLKPPETPRQSIRQSESRSPSSSLSKRTPASPSEASSSKFCTDTPPTPVSPNSTFSWAKPRTTSSKDRTPPPKFSLWSSNAEKDELKTVHITHEKALIDNPLRKPISDENDGVQLKGLGISIEEADLIYRATGQILIRLDGTPYKELTTRKFLEKSPPTSPVGGKPLPSLISSTSPIVANDISWFKSPSASLKREISNPTPLPAIKDGHVEFEAEANALIDGAATDKRSELQPPAPAREISKTGTIEPFKQISTANPQELPGADIIKPLQPIKTSPSGQKFHQFKKRRDDAEKAVIAAKSSDLFDKWRDSARALVTSRSNSPTLPENGPADGFPFVRPNRHVSEAERVMMTIPQLRIKLGLGERIPAGQKDPLHPNHLFLWHTKNVWCTQCMLEPTFIKDIGELGKDKSEGLVTEAPTDLLRAVPLKCALCESPCCVWAKSHFFLHDTNTNEPQNAVPGDLSITSGSRNSAGEAPRKSTAVVKDAAVVQARLHVQQLIKNIEATFLFGRDVTTFVRCSECNKLVCPDCAGLCPGALCGLVVCKVCADDPWAKCFLHL